MNLGFVHSRGTILSMKFSKSAKIAVLHGGLSREREVSLRTGAAITKALKEAGYTDVQAIDVGHDIAVVLTQNKPDVAFNALHGKFGEDGAIQGILEYLSIPYTGSGVLGSAISMDKSTTKKLFDYFKLPTLPWTTSFEGQNFDEFKNRLLKTLTFPMIAKPANEGSTIGIEIVHHEKDLEKTFHETLKFDSTVVWESFRKGRELTVGVLKGHALPIVEIRPKSGFYDYDAKYTKGATEYICPAEISPGLTKKIQDLALKAFAATRCSSFGRVDYIFEGDQPWLLEVNTVPGMTETSLFPKAAKVEGMEFPEFCEIILQDASLKKF
ncbi:MAG: D-alanine--D-alanine ligase [Bdellovibrionota bacterium]